MRIAKFYMTIFAIRMKVKAKQFQTKHPGSRPSANLQDNRANIFGILKNLYKILYYFYYYCVTVTFFDGILSFSMNVLNM
jgi:hypothetical protein